MSNRYFVYILTNRPKGVLYVGVTNNLVRRMNEHKGKYVSGFTSRYGISRLVHVEEFSSILEARTRERSIKRWHRAWKMELVEKENADWLDLSEQLTL